MTGQQQGKKVSASQVLRDVLTAQQRQQLLALVVQLELWPQAQKEEFDLVKIIEESWNGR